MKLNDSESNNRERNIQILPRAMKNFPKKKCSKLIYINSARFIPALDVTAPAKLDFLVGHYSVAKYKIIHLKAVKRCSHLITSLHGHLASIVYNKMNYQLFYA